jgi:predicted ATPase
LLLPPRAKWKQPPRAERVTAKGGNCALTDDEAPYVAEMCRKMDGIPVVIEMTAGQVVTLGVRNA